MRLQGFIFVGGKTRHMAIQLVLHQCRKQVDHFSLPILLHLTKQGIGPMASVLTHLLTNGGPNTEIRATDLWCAQFCYILKSFTLSATATLAPFSRRRDTIPVCFFCVALRRGVSPSCNGKEKKSRPLM